jgi:hypothetical protein
MFTWRNGIEKDKANSILAIIVKIRSNEPEKIQIDDLKNAYNNSLNKQKYIEKIEKELFNGKKSDKKEEKFKYFLLRDYVKLYDPDSLLYFKQCFTTTYTRVATLHDMIGIHLNALPLPVSWFTTRNSKFIILLYY